MASFKDQVKDNLRFASTESSEGLQSFSAPPAHSGRDLARKAGVAPGKEQESKNVQRDLGLKDEGSERSARCWTHAWLYPELPWGAPPTWGKQRSIHSGVTFLKFWDILLFAGLMYVAFSVPYQIGFNSVDGSSVCVFSVRDQAGIIFAVGDARCGEKTCYQFWTLNYACARMIYTDSGYGDTSVDFIFTADIAINFFTARWVVSTVGTPHWELVNELPRIRSIYLSGSFWIDLLGQIPWQYLDCIFSEVDRQLKLLRLLRLMKLFRLHRIRRMVQALKRKFPQSGLAVTAMELALTMCIAAHWLCCLWFSVGYPSRAHPDGWVLVEGLVVEMEDGSFTSQRTFHEWITSFYWAITTMSTIGYGDISATTTYERGVASVVMVLGCGFFAWATGRLTNILTQKSICSENFESKMSQMQEYFQNRGISERLVDRAMSYYMLKFPTLRMFDETAILTDLPLELSKELLVELYADVIEQSHIFGALSKKVQKELCYRIKPQFVEAGAVISAEGTSPHAMYVVRFGFVQLSARGEELRIAQRGDVFGELELVGLSHSRERKRTARAVTVCDLCVIAADDWWELLKVYSHMGKSISAMSNKLVRDLEQSLRSGHSVASVELLCPRWDLAAAHLRATSSSAAERELAAAGSQVSAAARAMRIRTWLHMEFTGIEFVSPEDAPMCHVFIVVTCTDENGEVGAVGESKLFPVRAEGGTAAILQPIKVLLFHSHNDWEAMPGLHVRVYQSHALVSAASGALADRFYEPQPRSPDGRHASARETRSARQQEIEQITGSSMTAQAQADAERKQQRDSRKYEPSAFSQRGPAPQKRKLAHILSRRALDLMRLLPTSRAASKERQAGSPSQADKFKDCQVLWEGVIPLKPLIYRRGEGCVHQFRLDPAGPPPSAARGTGEWAPGSSVTVALACKVLRMLQPDSRWYALLPVLAAKGASMGSEFFKRKREQEVRTMMAAAGRFGQVTATHHNRVVMNICKSGDRHRLLEGPAHMEQDMAKYVEVAVDKASSRFVETLAEQGLVAADARAAWRERVTEARSVALGQERTRAAGAVGTEQSESNGATEPSNNRDVVKKAFWRVAGAGQVEKGEGVAEDGEGRKREEVEKERSTAGAGEAGMEQVLRQQEAMARQQEQVVRGQRAMEERISAVEQGVHNITQLLQAQLLQTQLLQTLVAGRSSGERAAIERAAAAPWRPSASSSFTSNREGPHNDQDYAASSEGEVETPRGLLEPMEHISVSCGSLHPIIIG